MKHRIFHTLPKLTQRLTLVESLIYRRTEALAPLRYHPLTTPAEPLELPADTPPLAEWPEILPDAYWGQPSTPFVLRGQFQVPSDWSPSEATPLILYLPIGDAGDFIHPECLVYLDGEPYVAIDRYHQEVPLPPSFADGAGHQLTLHGWSGLMGSLDGFGGGPDTFGGKPTQPLQMGHCQLVEIHQPSRDFVATARVALGVAEALDDDNPSRHLILNALDTAFKILDTRQPFGEAFYESVAPAHASLRSDLTQAGPPLPVELFAAGHAHIDVAWLWPLAVTPGKAARTFHTALQLMAEFPDYHFTQSQPQLYQFIKDDHPALFERIKAQVEDGRWEAIGGMWVEADCNLSGSESLARQFLLGRNFFREHFGPQAESPVLWLPDVFGYSAALPQLIKQAGLDYFMTIKISWNQYNRLPYDSFWWHGLDGTPVLTHFSTAPSASLSLPNASTYNAKTGPKQILGTWQNFQQKAEAQSALYIYGHGDGGGGPTREMLENLREMKAFPGLPQTQSSKAIDFFRHLEAESGDNLPSWHGELYLEYHRGTYTTQSRTKRGNRKSEFLLHDAEFLACVAAQLDPDYDYPAEALQRAWQAVCLNQFHDIIPGSSIGEVYEDAIKLYAQVELETTALRDEALNVIAFHTPAGLLVVNPTSFERQDVAFWGQTLGAGQAIYQADGTPVPTQHSDLGTWLAPPSLPPYSVTPFFIENEASKENKANEAASETEVSKAPTKPLLPTLMVSPKVLENRFVRLELNAAGDIVRLYDKQAEREILPPGAIANQFQAFEDRPLNYEAWDIDSYFEDKHWLAEPALSVQVVEQGPLRGTLEIQRRILHSTYTQRISLTYNSPAVRFDTVIDWQEKRILLKTAFPVDVLAPMASYEVQWGHVSRPTHRNTSWDWARFETCAQKWVDLSEGDYGVSLLNDCKYGHDIKGQVMRLSLLRSPMSPDATADEGEHHFSYVLLPHLGGWEQAGGATIAAAYGLNNPLLVADGTGVEAEDEVGAAVSAWLAVDAPNVVIETIKQAEDGAGVIVRLYESQRRRGAVTLTAAFPLAEAWRTNLLEENETPLEVAGQSVNLAIKPFEIVTVRLVAVD